MWILGLNGLGVIQRIKEEEYVVHYRFIEILSWWALQSKQSKTKKHENVPTCNRNETHVYLLIVSYKDTKLDETIAHLYTLCFNWV